ncbi:hypothetical protein EV385_1381 [Krasilnikovia cinnamomea]|uniref:Uncharacterized protein n=1 Tax=Krasilnikovia cinnamomea TaxID=349313 RepID=A0A4Q7ZFX3_9ACTN|nr:hypothetical protein EV385_1381 [Krasilnikovia cinnamomea]
MSLTGVVGYLAGHPVAATRPPAAPKPQVSQYVTEAVARLVGEIHSAGLAPVSRWAIIT